MKNFEELQLQNRLKQSTQIFCNAEKHEHNKLKPKWSPYCISLLTIYNDKQKINTL